jgi:hypothetical protein
MNGVVYSIRDETPGLGGIFACGAFTATGSSGSTTLYRIANGYIGGPWTTYPQIDNGEVYDCVRYNDGTSEVILVGGSFANYGGGSPCLNILGYNISSASYFPVGTSGGFSEFNGIVWAFTKKTASSEVYIGGDFSAIAGNPYLYSVYFPFNNAQSPQNYDFGGSIRCILWDATNGVMYRGGGAVFAVDNTVYNGNPPFSIGLNITNRQSILPVPTQNKVYIPAYTGTGNYAYVYEPTSFVYWNSTPTPILNTSGGADWFNISSPSKGNSFTLKGSLVGGAKWYVMSFIGVSFS